MNDREASSQRNVTVERRASCGSGTVNEHALGSDSGAPRRKAGGLHIIVDEYACRLSSNVSN
jgi:hypothetical protein